MKAHITYTADGTITSLAIGDGPLEAEEGISAEVDLPDDFPSLW